MHSDHNYASLEGETSTLGTKLEWGTSIQEATHLLKATELGYLGAIAQNQM